MSASSSSSSERTPPVAEQQQQGAQRVVRKPPFADWPTIKIVTPPQGRFSNKTDEWCFTFANQSITGRLQGKEPNTRSFCVRRVFAHEVRNIMEFKNHHPSVGADGKARYPLPGEGQPANLPRILGGLPKETEDEDLENGPSRPPAPAPTKHWDEGWYLWSGKGSTATLNKFGTMRLDLQKQQAWYAKLQNQRTQWKEYQDHLKQGPGEAVGELGHDGTTRSKWYGPLIPPQPWPDTASSSILVSLPPELPSIWEKIDKFLTPTYRTLTIFRESLAANEHPQFAKRVWEKAQTGEPFLLARRSIEHAYDQWKSRGAEEDDEKKGST